VPSGPRLVNPTLLLIRIKGATRGRAKGAEASPLSQVEVEKKDKKF